MKCEYCGRDVIKVVNSKKYNKKLCQNCYWDLQNNYKTKTNKIIGNQLYIKHKNKKLVFTFNKAQLPIVVRENWQIKEVNKIPYLVNSKGHFLIKKLIKADSIDQINFINSYLDYRQSNLFVAKFKRHNNKIITEIPNIYKYKYGYRMKLDSNNYTDTFSSKGKVALMWYFIKECIQNKEVQFTNRFGDLLRTTTLMDRENIFKQFANKFCKNYLTYLLLPYTEKSSTFAQERKIYLFLKQKKKDIEHNLWKYKMYIDNKLRK